MFRVFKNLDVDIEVFAISQLIVFTCFSCCCAAKFKFEIIEGSKLGAFHSEVWCWVSLEGVTRCWRGGIAKR